MEAQANARKSRAKAAHRVTRWRGTASLEHGTLEPVCNGLLDDPDPAI
jgi:hypothetical protein